MQGPCKAPRPWFGDPVENAKLTTWKNLGNLDKFEAMRLYVLPIRAYWPQTVSHLFCQRYSTKRERFKHAERGNPIAVGAG
eukprot:9083443-Pyramimonas_sp.AAC.1